MVGGQVVGCMVVSNLRQVGMDYNLVELSVVEVGALLEEVDDIVVVAAAAAAAVFANENFEIHSRNWHTKHFAQQEAWVPGVVPIEDYMDQQSAVGHAVAVQLHFPTRPNNLLERAEVVVVPGVMEAAEEYNWEPEEMGSCSF